MISGTALATVAQHCAGIWPSLSTTHDGIRGTTLPGTLPHSVIGRPDHPARSDPLAVNYCVWQKNQQRMVARQKCQASWLLQDTKALVKPHLWSYLSECPKTSALGTMSGCGAFYCPNYFFMLKLLGRKVLGNLRNVSRIRTMQVRRLGHWLYI